MSRLFNRKEIYIIDSSILVHQGLSSILYNHPRLHICGGTSYYERALTDIKLLRPDIVIIEPFTDTGITIQLMQNIRESFPGIYILVLSCNNETSYADILLKEWANGIIMKSAPLNAIVNAILTVLSGRLYLSEPLLNKGQDENTLTA